jgi:hypothetical protein
MFYSADTHSPDSARSLFDANKICEWSAAVMPHQRELVDISGNNMSLAGLPVMKRHKRRAPFSKSEHYQHRWKLRAWRDFSKLPRWTSAKAKERAH